MICTKSSTLENQKKINRRLDKIEAEIAPENKEK